MKTTILKTVMVLQVFLALVITAPMADAVGLSVNGGQHTVQNSDVFSFIEATGTAHVDILGGSVESHLRVLENATVNLSGGNLFWGAFNGGPGINAPMYIETNGQVTIYGSGFEIGGQPVIGTLDLNGLTASGALILNTGSSETDSWLGHLTGVLQDDTPIDVDFIITRAREVWGYNHTANITLVPEPVSLLTLGLGGFLLRKRSSSNTHLN